ncbi:MAG: hypothetical protein ACR2L8_17805 [Solirubrobacteraceae bacterium]
MGTTRVRRAVAAAALLSALAVLAGGSPASAASAGVACGTIVFTPATEDGAFDIRATGTGCRSARKLVRRVARRHNFVSGPRRFRVREYRCTVITEDEGLPVGHYRCRAGRKRVTWDKS